MLDICNTKGPTEFKAPKTTLQTKELGPVGKKPRAKSGHKKTIPSMINNPLSKLEVTKGRPFIKEATQTAQSKKRKKSITAKDKNPNQTLVSTHVVTEMHKEDLQAATVQTSLGGTGELSQLKLIPAYPLLRILYLNNKEFFEIKSDKKDQRSISDDDNEIKLEDLTELVKDKDDEAIDLDSLEDDEPIQAGTSSWVPCFTSESFFYYCSAQQTKVLNALPNFLNKVAEALDRFATTIESTLQKVGDHSVPLVVPAGTHPVKGEKNTFQATITKIFQSKK
nr:hypothetical protein [Tanacetum cinerariifolium]